MSMFDDRLPADLDACIDAAIIAGYQEQPLKPDPWAELAGREVIAAEPW